MYKRLIFLTLILLGAVAGLGVLGYRAIEMQAEGLRGRRLGEFAAVAEQVRRDINRKLDDFLQTEQNRPYTDYLYYYVPEQAAPTQAALPLLRSPLAQEAAQGLAWGYFQVEPDGSLTNPYFLENVPTQNLGTMPGMALAQPAQLAQLENYLQMVRAEVLPRLNIRKNQDKFPTVSQVLTSEPEGKSATKSVSLQKAATEGKGETRQSYKMEIQANQAPKVMQQSRAVASYNLDNNSQMQTAANAQPFGQQGAAFAQKPDLQQQAVSELPAPAQPAAPPTQSETVQIRIEPFVPLRVAQADPGSLLGGSVFLLRHVQIENRHLLQGFRLNEARLLEEIRESAGRLLREGMDFSLDPAERENTDFAAVLDFDFGQLVLNLREQDPARIARQIGQMRHWYFGVIGVAAVAMVLALGSVWRNMHAQLKLARKKDDFISAVSHELRTPLTSIRMYTEMLEKDWVRSEEKRREYYGSMRQESERLSRLIENVLDFSRISRGKKQYQFKMGDLNGCVERVLEMISPYVTQAGFTLEKQLAQLPPLAFDQDAVTQIIINLVDNAVKYARGGAQRQIILRTRLEREYVIIEVEDRGPGVPHRQREKVFDPFYRCEGELSRETAGVGLGLALVKKFAQAHHGFVEIAAAQPAGAIFRVGLPIAD